MYYFPETGDPRRIVGSRSPVTENVNPPLYQSTDAILPTVRSFHHIQTRRRFNLDLRELRFRCIDAHLRWPYL